MPDNAPLYDGHAPRTPAAYTGRARGAHSASSSDNLMPASPTASTGLGTKASGRRLKPHMVFLITLALFAISCGVRIALALFDKHIAVYPDEYYYLDITRSLFSTGIASVRGQATAFQNYLCSITMMPAMLMPDTYSQIMAIGVLNSIYVSTSAFPAMLMGRKLFRNDWLVIAGVALTLILPDFVYSITFMSESIFLPLGMWTLLLLWETIESEGMHHHIVMGAASGAVLYLLYFTKIVALYMFVAFVIVSALHANEQRKSWREQAASCIAAAAAFLAIYLVLKLALFTQPSTYSSSSNVFGDTGKMAYLGFAFICNFLFALVGLFYFPIIYPALTVSTMDRRRKDLFALCLASLVVGVAVVSYMISVKEGYGDVVTRQHLRYYAPLVAPFMLVFIAQLEDGEDARGIGGRYMALVATATAGICVLLCFYLNRISWTAVIDSTMLQYFNVACDSLGTLMAAALPSAPWGDADIGLLLMKGIIVAVICLGTLFLFISKPKYCSGAIFAIIVALCVANNVFAMNIFKTEYASDKTAIDEVMQISDYLTAQCEENPDAANVLVILDDSILDSIPTRMEETYLVCPNRYQMYWKSIRVLEKGKGCIDLSTDRLFLTDLSRVGQKDYPEVSHIDYIVMATSMASVTLAPGSYKIVQQGSESDIALYQNLDTSKVHVITPEE